MADRLRFNRLVASDLREAIQWYDDISVGLGNRFRKLVETRFDEIAEHPERFPCAFGDVRFARLQRFPYLVQFREVSEVVFVLGVFQVPAISRSGDDAPTLADLNGQFCDS